MTTTTISPNRTIDTLLLRLFRQFNLFYIFFSSSFEKVFVDFAASPKTRESFFLLFRRRHLSSCLSREVTSKHYKLFRIESFFFFFFEFNFLTRRKWCICSSDSIALVSVNRRRLIISSSGDDNSLSQCLIRVTFHHTDDAKWVNKCERQIVRQDLFEKFRSFSCRHPSCNKNSA